MVGHFDTSTKTTPAFSIFFSFLESFIFFSLSGGVHEPLGL
jgi:hypothetical protein